MWLRPLLTTSTEQVLQGEGLLEAEVLETKFSLS